MRAAEQIIYKNYEKFFNCNPNFQLNYIKNNSGNNNPIINYFNSSSAIKVSSINSFVSCDEATIINGGPDEKIKNKINSNLYNLKFIFNKDKFFEKALKLVYKDYKNPSILYEPEIIEKIKKLA